MASLLSVINVSRRRHRHHYNYLTPLLRHHSSATSSKTTTASPLEVPLTHPTYFIWSANTSLGKTLVSTGLAFSSLLQNTRNPSKFVYLKPVQTGFPSDSDSAFVFTKLSSLCRLHKPYFPVLSSHHILKSSLSAAAASTSSSVYGDTPTEFLQNRDNGMVNLGLYEERKTLGEEANQDNCSSELVCKTIFAYNEAVSPHLAAEREGGIVDDAMVVRMLERCLRLESESQRKEKHVFCVVETAGGIASPGPSGSLQCDLYRQFRLPAVLVGDGRLGGISGTITAYESLMLRGYDVVAIIFENHGLHNEVPLRSYLRNSVPVLVLPKVPEDLSNNLMEWFDCSGDVFDSLRDIMQTSYEERVHKLLEMPKKARDKFWWPFTQHSLVPEGGVAVIDSRCGENFAIFKDSTTKSVTEMFDACASWWTQGPNATLQIELARDMGYAAARFGHVMFPENVHQPALESAELLLDGVGKGWASRVYFSDNGSTAIEIAIKMGFRRFSIDHGILIERSSDGSKEKTVELMVLALKGSYHGDTLGAMEAQSPSAYTGFLQQPWYTGRGLFLDTPTAFISDRIWSLQVPELLLSGMAATRKKTFNSREELFCKSRDKSELAGIYSSYISYHLSESRGSKYIASLIIEPVIQGAGGMHMVDPLFQRILVNECRSRKIPVIFDEVFTGFWRLGTESAAELLGCEPDIACYAKLLTGGIIPLAATLASSAIFDAFLGESKLDALLHGHSYSAHPMGCTAAAKSMKWFKDPQTNHNLTSHGNRLKELWDLELVNQISCHPAVERVVALGTLFAMELRVADKDAGYSSLYARPLLQMLRDEGIYMRPLGNVIYLMCGPCTSSQVCTQLLVKLYRNLEEFHHNNI